MVYQGFSLGTARTNYTLHLGTLVAGNAPDSLRLLLLLSLLLLVLHSTAITVISSKTLPQALSTVHGLKQPILLLFHNIIFLKLLF